jgi:hypothetical protein
MIMHTLRATILTRTRLEQFTDSIDHGFGMCEERFADAHSSRALVIYAHTRWAWPLLPWKYVLCPRLSARK